MPATHGGPVTATATRAPIVQDPTNADGDRPTVLRGTRWLLLLFGALTLLAFVVLFVRAVGTDRDFAWTVAPPLTASFYGAGYGAGCLLVLLSLRERSWVRIRVAVVTIFVFTVLSLSVTLRHLHRLHLMTGGDLARVAGWVWLVVYVVVPVALLVVILAERRRHGDDPPRSLPLPGWVAGVLAADGAVLLIAGVTLLAVAFTVREGTTRTFWPWSMTPLNAGVIAAWLIAFGVAAMLALAEDDLVRLEIPFLGYATFGVLQIAALARFGDHVQWHSPSAWAYLAVVLTMPFTGAYGWWAAQRSRRLGGANGKELSS